ncbi:MAG: cytochrome c oxidase subunit II [Desulfocapsaceae bacterium]|nr:cytochrome c oxidase subunit II [Desulfocapsaceae bacterium]
MNPVKTIDQAFWYILGVSLVLLVGITVVMIAFTIIYRRSKHPDSADIRGNWKLEVLWTVVPTLIALSMFAVGWSSYTGLRTVPPEAMVVEVTAQQFSWLFDYPGGKESEGELVVPVGKPIRLNITSVDVVHGFYLPAFRIKVDAVPNVKSYGWFLADKIGVYDIMCTVYCGTDHSHMTAKLRIVSDDEYRQWLQKN